MFDRAEPSTLTILKGQQLITPTETAMTPIETTILAGGCFWGMQDLLRKHPGVTATRVGYSGGDVPNATYRHHGSHAEAVEVVFDPSIISYRELLEFFFQIHDPSTQDRQGNDTGTSYRSAIFTTSVEQDRIARNTIRDVDASGLWPGPVVTEVSAAGPFWEAEPEHQDYLERIPDGYTCHLIRPGWRLPRAPTVLFVCVHNAGRSQMAAGYLTALAGDRITVLSAGSAPAESLNPMAVHAMAEDGIDIQTNVPKILTPETVQTSDVVITMGCGDACPYYPGIRFEDWVLDDPAGQGIEAVRVIRDSIKERVQALIAELLP